MSDEREQENMTSFDMRLRRVEKSLGIPIDEKDSVSIPVKGQVTFEICLPGDFEFPREREFRLRDFCAFLEDMSSDSFCITDSNGTMWRINKTCMSSERKEGAGTQDKSVRPTIHDVALYLGNKEGGRPFQVWDTRDRQWNFSTG